MPTTRSGADASMLVVSGVPSTAYKNPRESVILALGHIDKHIILQGEQPLIDGTM